MPVGGIVGLIEDDGAPPAGQGAGSRGANSLTLGAMGAVTALVLAVAWVARRRLIG